MSKSLKHDELWANIDWKTIRIYVHKLQKLIYMNAKNGNIKAVRKTQHLLTNSYYSRLLAVKQVTQNNKNKKIAGIDNIKTLHPKKHIELAKKINIKNCLSPLKKVKIAKPGRKKKEEFVIATIHDRVLQTLFKFAIEPEWEAYFDPNSYGFRTGRNKHDAIKAILIGIEKKPKYVLVGDISECFEKLNPDILLNKMGMIGKFEKKIKTWLKNGVLDPVTFEPESQNTIQEGILSPLLVNIALTGLETELKNYINTVPLRTPKGVAMGKRDKRRSLQIIRYSSHFVVLHYDSKVIQDCNDISKSFFFYLGLNLDKYKYKFSHTLELTSSENLKMPFFQEKPGFDFLGFTIIQKKTKHYSAFKNKKKLYFRTLVFPSKSSCVLHQRHLKYIITRGNNLDQDILIYTLNPIISHWSRYFGCSDAMTLRILAKMDHLLYLKLRRWSKRRNKTAAQGTKYFRTIGNNKWIFATNTTKLCYHRENSSSIHKYAKVRSEYSPYDQHEQYWTLRLCNNPMLSKTVQNLLKKQKGRCKICNLLFLHDEIMEVDHIKPLSQGGVKEHKNLQLLCRSCHDTKTREDFSIFNINRN